MEDQINEIVAGAWLRGVIDSLPRAIIVTDNSGRITVWNAEAERLYGWAEAEVQGKTVLEVLLSFGAAPADHSGELDNAKLLARTLAGEAHRADRVVVRRNGDPVRIHAITKPIVDQDGNVTAIVGASEDVTELRPLERQSIELAEHLRLALDAGGFGTWRWDIATGIVKWDERMEGLYGFEPGSYDGTFESYVALLHPDDREDVLATVRAAVEAKSSYRVEHRAVWHDGSVHSIAGAGTVTRDPDGGVTGTIGCSNDVTERVEQAQERERLAVEALAAADRERLQLDRFQFLSSVNDALNASPGIADIMVNVTQAAVPRLGDWCAIHVLRDDSPIPDIELAHVDPDMVAYARELQERFPYDPEAVTGIPQVIRSGKPEFYPDIDTAVLDELEVDDEARAIIDRLALRSSIAVPLVKHGQTLGAIHFVLSDPARRYSDDDLALARMVASRIAVSLHNRRSGTNNATSPKPSNARCSHRRCPRSTESILRCGTGLRVKAPRLAAISTMSSPDFYDVFAIGDNTWGVVIGDVCGTGPTAAAVTGLARHCIREAAWHGDNEIEVLASLNLSTTKLSSPSCGRCLSVVARCEIDDLVRVALLDERVFAKCLLVAGGERGPEQAARVKVQFANDVDLGAEHGELGLEVQPGEQAEHNREGAVHLAGPLERRG